MEAQRQGMHAMLLLLLLLLHAVPCAMQPLLLFMCPCCTSSPPHLRLSRLRLYWNGAWFSWSTM
jgi:hypothetical protein